jgi:Family of unknown function (DUF6527)
MSSQEQYDVFEKAFGPEWNFIVVPCKEAQAWVITGDFSNMTVTPSLDASASGHWHGSITNGECQ